MATYLFYCILLIIVIEYILSRTLSYLNSKSWHTNLPKKLEFLYTKAAYNKAKNYAIANQKVNFWAGLLSTTSILAMLFFDGFALLDDWLRQFTDNSIYLALAFFGILLVISDVLSLPISIYSTFVIEEKFGFNKMTWKTFVGDKVKGYILGGILGGAIMALLIYFYEWAGSWFWVYAWGLITAISLFFVMFSTSLIMPIFNKFTPLEDGELRKAIEEYAQRVNFPLKNIFIMDGSKRSAKGNAFFSGLGSQKSIVLFDTLIAEQSKEELVAVLAHEVGHYKKKHIPQSILLSIIQTGVLLFILNFALSSPHLSAALGVQEPSFHIGLLAFSLLYTPISLLVGILMNIFSRKNEFEADNYAKTTYDGEALENALKKLSVNHLSNPTPHPAFVFFYYSHPPLLQRIEALKN